MTMLDAPVAPAPADERRRFQFTVKGLPGPQGSKSYKGHSRKGHAILVESSAKVAPWRTDVVLAAERQIEQTPGFKPFSGPVHLVIEFYLPRPKSAPKTRRTVPDVVPDLSKLIRSTEDAMKTAAVWRDDAQVVDITTRKRYATFGDELIGHPWELPGTGCVVTVIELDANDTWADQPLENTVGARFPGRCLPLALETAVVRMVESVSNWGSHTLIPRDATDAQARKVVAKVLKESQQRFERLRDHDRAPDEATALIIEGGRERLMSVPGQPLSQLQLDVAAILDMAEHGTEVVVILGDQVR